MDQLIDTFYHFIIDRKKRDDLDHLECNGRSVVNPDTMRWSNNGDDNLETRKYINFKINEHDGSVTYEQIYVCTYAWFESVEEFLTEHAIRVCPETTILV